MRKVRKLDFILEENDDLVTIFRFYPRRSSCHSFNDTPPTKWDEVYKVYYCYSIFARYKDGSDSKILFESECDECSVIDGIAERCKLIADGTKVLTRNCDGEEYRIELLNSEVYPFGYGVSWMIEECKQKGYFKINMWNWRDIGFRFVLDKDQLRKFGEYLLQCCEYMLTHGDPI